MGPGGQGVGMAGGMGGIPGVGAGGGAAGAAGGAGGMVGGGMGGAAGGSSGGGVAGGAGGAGAGKKRGAVAGGGGGMGMSSDLWVHSDDREVKKQRRKQSNRESARRSRLRKQAECEDLMGRVRALTDENQTIRVELQRMQEECHKMAQQNALLQERLNGKAAPGGPSSHSPAPSDLHPAAALPLPSSGLGPNALPPHMPPDASAAIDPSGAAMSLAGTPGADVNGALVPVGQQQLQQGGVGGGVLAVGNGGGHGGEGLGAAGASAARLGQGSEKHNVVTAVS
ncbi:unnamed protein product [Closterium sp. NIES-53]